MEKVRATFKIENYEVERTGNKVGGLQVYQYSDDCDYRPEIILFFVDEKTSRVMSEIHLNGSGGPESSCGICVSFGKGGDNE